jgi:hypothetical protein
MSEGPISQWWKSHAPERVTIADSKRVCMGQHGRGYCGRRSAPLTQAWSKVTCPDCRAAYRADGGRL